MGTILKFYINKNKKSTIDNCCPICLRIVHRRRKSEGRISTTPISELGIQYWISDSQRFSKNQKKFQSHNILLNEIENELHNYLRDNLTEINTKTPADIRDHLLSRTKFNIINIIAYTMS